MVEELQGFRVVLQSGDIVNHTDLLPVGVAHAALVALLLSVVGLLLSFDMAIDVAVIVAVIVVDGGVDVSVIVVIVVVVIFFGDVMAEVLAAQAVEETTVIRVL